MARGAPKADCGLMATMSKPSEAPPPAPPRRLHVVLADDSEVFRRALAEFLTLYTEVVVVAEAQDGEAAIAAVEHTTPDLVLMDVRMPGLGGLEATRRLKSAPGGPWVVLLTLGYSKSVKAAAGAVGADGLIHRVRSWSGCRRSSTICGQGEGHDQR